MELKFISTKKLHDKVVNLSVSVDYYKVEDYTVIVTAYEDGCMLVRVKKDMEDSSERKYYMPSIYGREDIETGDLIEFVIQTTSYGSLSIEETKKMMADIEKGIAVAEFLTEKFINKK